MKQTIQPKPDHHYHFVTGQLAEFSLRDIVETLAQKYRFDFTIGVMPITVAALMTPKWLKRHLDVPDQATHVILPGYCSHGVELLIDSYEIPVICGPNDYRWLPELFGEEHVDPNFDQYEIDIIAEINHAPRLSIAEVESMAKRYRDNGANVIDIGCDPISRCLSIGDYVKALIDHGLQVSIDTFDPWEAKIAVEQGASLVLSVNSTNRDAAADWGCEVVVVPDVPGDQKSFEKTINFLEASRVSFRLDPILEPIGTSFANSLIRYAEVRHQFPDHAMMMGIGNLTELTDVDSAGVNFLLLAICQELSIGSVLTTEVINWARSSVRECDVARRVVSYSLRNGVPPKRLSDQLVMLRDPKLRPHTDRALAELASAIKDNNYRLFAQDDLIHLVSAGIHLFGDDPFELFDRLLSIQSVDNVDPSHAFYLGYEMAKASIATTLGKQYNQDQALNWGMLTVDEDLHRLKRTSRHRSG
jgi:dihydropteroate synthase-like protein